jgi:hypothetical protein
MGSFLHWPMIRASSCASIDTIYLNIVYREMFALEDFKYTKRHQWSPITTITDVADYPVGYVFSLWPITIFKLKVSKIMDAPRYVTIIKIFGLEYQKT